MAETRLPTMSLPSFYTFVALFIVALAEPKGTSISGISSGAYMATQYEVAFSSEIVGVGVIAGGPYYCAKGSVTDALIACMSSPALIDVSQLLSATKTFAAASQIDSLEHLKSHSVYIFSGKADKTVVPGVVAKAEQMYRDLGVTKITSDYNSAAGHSFPTNDYGNACGTTASPYITNCNLDGAGALFRTIYGTLNTPKPALPENRRSITKFLPSGETASGLSLWDEMYYYEASYCNGNCTIHVALHGCQMTFYDIGTQFVEHAGYNKWAEANDMVILYPFTIKKSFLPSNPNGCWDWWGYDDANYAVKRGPQMQTIRNMIRYFQSPH